MLGSLLKAMLTLCVCVLICLSAKKDMLPGQGILNSIKEDRELNTSMYTFIFLF